MTDITSIKKEIVHLMLGFLIKGITKMAIDMGRSLGYRLKWNCTFVETSIGMFLPLAKSKSERILKIVFMCLEGILTNKIARLVQWLFPIKEVIVG